MTDIRVSNRSELLSALDSARGGETIVLASGNYGALSVGNKYASLVTLQAESPREAKFSDLKVTGASNLRFDGIHVSSDSNGWEGGRVVDIGRGSQNIQIVNSEINARIDDVFFGHQGIQVLGASNILLQDNYVHNVHHGISVFGVKGVEVRGNKIDYVGEDHLKFAGVENAVIEGNHGGGNVFPPRGGHPDFIQFQSSSRNVEIRDNVYLADTISWMQGIFLWDGTYNDILIEGNVVSTGMMRGISVQRGEGIVVQNNTLLNVPGEVHNHTIVKVPSGALVRDNIQTSYTGSLNDNLTMQNSDPNKPLYVGDYFEGGMKGRGLTLEDLKPVAGSLGETMGAAETIAKLLGGAAPGVVDQPAAPAPSQPAPTEPDPEPEASAPQPSPVSKAPIQSGAEDFVFLQSGDMAFSGGSSGIVNVAHDPALEIAEGTIGFGFNAASTRGTQGLVSKDAAGPGDHLTAYLEGRVLKVRVEDGEGGLVRLEGGNIRAGRDYDVAISFAEDDIRLYLNGRLMDTDTFTMDWRNNPEYLQIGGAGWRSDPGADTAHNAFRGTISDVAIHNRAMTAEEFDQLV